MVKAFNIDVLALNPSQNSLITKALAMIFYWLKLLYPFSFSTILLFYFLYVYWLVLLGWSLWTDRV